MFDLKFYKKLLKIVSAAITPVPLVMMDTHHFRSTGELPKTHTQFNREFGEDIINLSFYFEQYLRYFNLEFKEQFNSKLSNKHYSNWCS